ncbi:hypothetical protein KC19_VG068100 [Ceratodon purpureus]|uniref:ERCC4 domain-containing protein n=1 Tax=Ceratodon purpureus TaxID=3225 RepID=A0A8T0HMQ7_CERPU|nr:hypothetical protein KC19_VG068100 [Ceratodon purpureus]
MALAMSPLEREVVLDNDSEDEDNDLLVDWRGTGGGSSFVQQKLPFKKVKNREGFKTSSALFSKSNETLRATSAPRVILSDGVVPVPDVVKHVPVVVKPISDVVKPVPEAPTRPIAVVSLSDSDVSAPPRSAVKRPNNNSHRVNPSGTGNVVCLDSDTDSEQSFERWLLNPCNASQHANLLEKVVEKDDEVDHPLHVEQSLDGFLGTPSRGTSIDRDCTLDPFGSGRFDSFVGEGPMISSTSKRPASSLWARDDAVSNSQKGSPSECISDDDLRFTSPRVEHVKSRLNVTETTDLNLRETTDLNRGTNFSTLPSRNLNDQLREVLSEQEAPGGGIRKKRKVTSKTLLSEEDKALERNEKLRAKEAERLRKAEEKAEMKRLKDEEKKKFQEGNRRKREEEKQRKEAAKEEAKERRRVEHEKKRWETGKFALQNTRANIDTKVVEKGLIGGHLLTKLAEKQLQFQLVSNPCPRSIMWRMKRPSEDSSGEAASRFWDAEDVDTQTEGPCSKLVLEEVDIPYILFVLEAEEFTNLVGEDTLRTLISSTQTRYPGFTICFLVNKLKWYLHKKDQTQYKSGDTVWKRPPVEQAVARLLTHYNGVHSRLCLDEAEVAEHITGLTRSLAECPFKAKSTSLSVSKNGDHVTTSDTFKEEIKRSLWLKALVALPLTPGAVALAVAKKYCNMRALLKAYLDPSKTVHQKELLLQDLIREGVFGPEQRRRVGPACSRRIYRIFMARNGNLKTDDVEQGADHFDDSD